MKLICHAKDQDVEKRGLISILKVNNSSDVTYLDELRPLRAMAGQLPDPIQSNYVHGGLWRDAELNSLGISGNTARCPILDSFRNNSEQQLSCKIADQ